ncbi:hypothetical protein ACFVWG_00185 [Kribbella sp. NPDC058245]|uniref:hypothetical protein n=1 Tax=Kribbella sp. NPDC058245 TaxID=3346399 RepID=UPI0036EB2834
MRAKRVVLVGGLLLATVLGVAGGYATGVLTYPSSVTVSGVPAPLGGITTSPTTTPLPIKTAEPNGYEALDPDALEFHRLEFTIDLVQNDQGVDPPPVRLSVRVPKGWKQSVTEKGEAKFTDPTGTRWIRVSPVYPVKQTPRQKRDQLVPSLQSSIPHEQVFKVLSQSDDVPVGTDDQKRRVSKLTYSYIPIKWLRPVIVEYVATAGQDAANFEMSVTGFPLDQAALDLIAERAAVSVLPEG